MKRSSDTASIRDRKLDVEPVLEQLSQIVQVDLLQLAQDTLSSAIGVPILFVAPDGSPITKSDQMDSFCWHVAKKTCAQEPCRDCDRLQNAAKFHCPMDIRDVILPIEAGDIVVGYLIASQAASERLDDATPALSMLAAMVSRLATAERENIFGRIRDPLTGLASRAHFWECLTRELEVADTYHYPVSVLVFDLDDFKSVNSVYGHDMGDRVLRTVGEILRKEIRTTDIAARYSGDSFLVMLRCADPIGAEAVAWRILNKLNDIKLTARGQLVPVAASVGMVTYPACAAREPDAIFKEALTSLTQTRGCELRVAS